MRHYKAYLLMLLALPFMAACSENDEVSAIAAIIPTGLEGQCIPSGAIHPISYSARADSDPISRAVIETFDSERGHVVLKDTSVSTMLFDDVYYYRAPELEKSDSTDVHFTFTFYNTGGRSRSVKRKVCVVRSDAPLETYTGVTLYGDEDSDGTQANGYCLSENRPVIVSLADSAQVDIFIPRSADGSIVRELQTNTDVHFARSNSFDFAKASKRSVTEAYNASLRNPKIGSLRDADIVLIGRKQKAVGVIQVMQIVEGPTPAETRYVLNIKTMK